MAKPLLAKVAISPAELAAQRVRSPFRSLNRNEPNSSGTWLTHTPLAGHGLAIGMIRVVMVDDKAASPPPAAKIVLTSGSDVEEIHLGYVPQDANWHINFQPALVTAADVVVSFEFDGMSAASIYSVWMECFRIKLHAPSAGLASTSGVSP